MSTNFLTREQILGLSDIETKEIEIPSHIPGWGGKKVFIRQLTRGHQDEYLKRQYGDTRMRQDRRAKNQEITAVNIYGHDAWLCVRGMCDEKGAPLFKNEDEVELKKKNGEAIGWIAQEIIKFSGMDAEAKIARGETTEEEQLKEEVKN